MSEAFSVLRIEIAQFLQSRESTHVRFPEALKASVLAHAHRERSRGTSLEAIAEGLGLSFNTLRGWVYAKRRIAKLKPVVVVADRKTDVSAPVLVTPGGHRVEGLDVRSMAELLRGLS